MHVSCDDDAIRSSLQAELSRQQAKLQALEVGGLVDVTDEAATFVVIGSTGASAKGAKALGAGFREGQETLSLAFRAGPTSGG